MQGVVAAFGEVSFAGETKQRRALPLYVAGAAALVLTGSVAAYVAQHRVQMTPEPGVKRSAPRTAPSPAGTAATASNPFGEIIIEPGWGPKSASNAESVAPHPDVLPVTASASKPASDDFPASSLDSAPPARLVLPEIVPLPPIRDVARIDDSIPLPPVRPPEFGQPAAKAPLDRRMAEPGPKPASAPAESPNLFQKLLGLVRPPGSAVTSAAPGSPGTAPSSSRVDASSIAAAPSRGAGSLSATQQGRGGGGLFTFFSSTSNVDRLGYDRLTAVYDISARTVYLPDGTKLEAHSGLGARLDDPRFVSEPARGPTPPHLYELTMRESLFHGVPAIRLNPIGEGGVYGRAGFLAHPYMLGPNGDSNGCVSVKDYEAFLRAYQNGQIKRLAVVARL